MEPLGIPIGADTVAPGPSPGRPTWEGDVLAELSSHVEAEREVLAEYARAAETVEEPDVRYLIRLILDDEVRHHRLLEEIARSLHSAADWQEHTPRVPDRGSQPLSEDVRRLTARFLAVEREDRRSLRALRHRLRPVQDTTLWPLLVDLMALDTEKHLRILKALAARGS